MTQGVASGGSSNTGDRYEIREDGIGSYGTYESEKEKEGLKKAIGS